MPIASSSRRGLTSLSLIIATVVTVCAQGTITFDAHVGGGGAYFHDLGMWFRLVIPPGTTGRDDMAIIAGGGNTPYNGTPFMGWFRQYNPYDYVSLSLTNGSLFGLSSVQLADPTAPSPAPVSISFVGYLPGGSTVTNTFTTPGNGATTFQNYTFTSDFAFGLASVDILAPRWAMDNLAYVIPEPSAAGLFLIGLLGWAAGRKRARRWFP